MSKDNLKGWVSKLELVVSNQGNIDTIYQKKHNIAEKLWYNIGILPFLTNTDFTIQQLETQWIIRKYLIQMETWQQLLEPLEHTWVLRIWLAKLLEEPWKSIKLVISPRINQLIDQQIINPTLEFLLSSFSFWPVIYSEADNIMKLHKILNKMRGDINLLWIKFVGDSLEQDTNNSVWLFYMNELSAEFMQANDKVKEAFAEDLKGIMIKKAHEFFYFNLILNQDISKYWKKRNLQHCETFIAIFTNLMSQALKFWKLSKEEDNIESHILLIKILELLIDIKIIYPYLKPQISKLISFLQKEYE